MSLERTLRRAAERKDQKLARKAEKANQTNEKNNNNMINNNNPPQPEPPQQQQQQEQPNSEPQTNNEAPSSPISAARLAANRANAKHSPAQPVRLASPPPLKIEPHTGWHAIPTASSNSSNVKTNPNSSHSHRHSNRNTNPSLKPKSFLFAPWLSRNGSQSAHIASNTRASIPPSAPSKTQRCLLSTCAIKQRTNAPSTRA